MHTGEREQFYASMKAEGLKIDPATAEVTFSWADTQDPYGIDPAAPDEDYCVGRVYFARNLGGEIWVSFRDLPDVTREALRSRGSAAFLEIGAERRPEEYSDECVDPPEEYSDERVAALLAEAANGGSADLANAWTLLPLPIKQRWRRKMMSQSDSIPIGVHAASTPTKSDPTAG